MGTLLLKARQLGRRGSWHAIGTSGISLQTP